jgi:hypothetical protein
MRFLILIAFALGMRPTTSGPCLAEKWARRQDDVLKLIPFLVLWGGRGLIFEFGATYDINYKFWLIICHVSRKEKLIMGFWAKWDFESHTHLSRLQWRGVAMPEAKFWFLVLRQSLRRSSYCWHTVNVERHRYIPVFIYQQIKRTTVP